MATIKVEATVAPHKRIEAKGHSVAGVVQAFEDQLNAYLRSIGRDEGSFGGDLQKLLCFLEDHGVRAMITIL